MSGGDAGARGRLSIAARSFTASNVVLITLYRPPPRRLHAARERGATQPERILAVDEQWPSIQKRRHITTNRSLNAITKHTEHSVEADRQQRNKRMAPELAGCATKAFAHRTTITDALKNWAQERRSVRPLSRQMDKCPSRKHAAWKSKPQRRVPSMASSAINQNRNIRA